MVVGCVLILALDCGFIEFWLKFLFLSNKILNASLLVWLLVWFSCGKVWFGGGSVDSFGGLDSCLTGIITGRGFASPCFSLLINWPELLTIFGGGGSSSSIFTVTFSLIGLAFSGVCGSLSRVIFGKKG